jgi:transposase
VRGIGLDVHLDFCEVAIFEAGELRSAGRIKTTPEALELFAQSLGAADRVALEVSGNAWGLWMPDGPTRALRRRLQRREQPVRGRSRAKNEIHAALMRRLVAKPKVSDLFGRQGRRWLAEVELPDEERETVAVVCTRSTSSTRSWRRPTG